MVFQILRSSTVALFIGLLILLQTTSAEAQKQASLAARANSISEYEKLLGSSGQLVHEDSVLVSLAQSKGMLLSFPKIRIQNVKCGSDLALEANHLYQKIPDQLYESIVLSTVSLSDSIKSASGKFTVYYEKEGVNASTTEYIDSIAHFADEAYMLEIVELGYPKPPFSGSDSTWHIFVSHLGGIFGITSPIGTNAFASSPTGLPLYRTYFSIDNGFPDSLYRTHGLDAAKITIFHEFQHVIQYGCYGAPSKDVNFREMTSVWMELRSSPDIKDYLFDLPIYLSHINHRFDNMDGQGYPQCVWMQFLEKKFSDDLIKNVWQFYSEKVPNFLVSFDSTLSVVGSSFCTEYKKFGAALYFTGRNFQGKSVFPDAKLFFDSALRKIVVQPNLPYTFTSNPASLNIFTCGYGLDSSVIAVSRSSNVEFFSNDTITSTGDQSFEAHYQFPLTFCDTVCLFRPIDTRIFPQPFVVSSSASSNVNILASRNPYSPLAVTLDIYSLNSQLIRHIEKTHLSIQNLPTDPYGGSWYVAWDGLDDLGHPVAGGIYNFYLLVDNIRYIGKIVVIRKN